MSAEITQSAKAKQPAPPVMEERARRIVEAVIELAEQGGFEAVRLRDVAAHADVALGTLYRRFGSKEELLVAALELDTQALEARIHERPPEGENSTERLVDFFTISTRGMVRRSNLSRAMLKAAASGDAALAEKVGDFHTTMQRMAVGALRGTTLPNDGAPLAAREELIGNVLNWTWFALMVGWAGGLHTQTTIVERMRATIELILEKEI